MAEAPAPIPKRIIICCDGSSQSAVSGKRSSPSNIIRLARSLERAGIDADGKVWQQIVWYDSGVGTTSMWASQKLELLTGAGLDGNIIEAYNFIALNYQPGDQIFCFGFSRGAYTARAIAGLVTDIGVCSPRDLPDFPELWELYKQVEPGKRFYGSDAWFIWEDGKGAEAQPDDLGYKNRDYGWERRPHGDWAVTAESREVEVVGVFDTVGSLGMPDVQGFHIGSSTPEFRNVNLNRNVKHAFHALALDEHREAFSPTLWHLPEENEDSFSEEDFSAQEQVIAEAQGEYYKIKDDRTVAAKTKQSVQLAYNAARRRLIHMKESQKPPSELLQVWFPGVHINIGGGSDDSLKSQGDLEEMANITFVWMLDQISPYLAVASMTVFQDQRALQNLVGELNEELRRYNDLEKSNAEAAKKNWSTWFQRTVNNAASSGMQLLGLATKPNTQRRDYGWGTGTMIESYTTMYKLNGSAPRTPGAYAKDKKHTTTGKTNEQVHPTVGYRMFATKKAVEDATKAAEAAAKAAANAKGTEKAVKTQEKKLADAEQAEKKKLVYQPLKTETEGVERRTNAQGGWEYRIHGVTLPEYRLGSGSKPNGYTFERLAFDYESLEYVQKLDKENGVETASETA